MTTSIEAVLAGSKGFALALLAPLAERLGTRPRVAADPAQALALCREGGLVVIEFAGEGSLLAVKDLVLRGPGLRIVAAVPAGHAAAEAPLRALGVELARWDGRPDGVLAAVSRHLEAGKAAAAASPPPIPVRPPAAAPRPPPRPAASPAATPGAAATAPGAVVGRAATSAPAGGLPASGRAPVQGPPPRRAAAATPPTVAAPPTVAVAPAATAPPAATAAPTVAAPPAVVASTSAAPPAAPSHPAPGSSMAPPPDAAASSAASVGPPSPAAPGAQAPPAAALFDDLPGGDDFDLDVADGQDAPAPAASLGAAAGGAWPGDVPGAAAAAEALARGLAGLFDPPGTPFGAVADVVEGLSDFERSVLEGAPQPLDAAPVRRAAVMRVRVAVALATAPSEGGAVDSGAVSAFLAEIDALLSEVGALAASAPPELQPSLEAVRNALVKEAIDFSEASHRGVPLEQIAAADAAAARAARAAQHTRIVSVASQAEAEIEQAMGKRRRTMIFALAASIVLAAAYHGYGVWRASRSAEEPPLRSGLPANARFAGDPTGKALGVVRSKDGTAFAPDEVKRLAELESLKGNFVHEAAKGVVVIIPGGEGKPPAPPPVPSR